MCLSGRLPKSIKYASLLSYVPKSRWRSLESAESLPYKIKVAYEYTIALKQDRIQPGGLHIYDSVAKWCADYGLFRDFFSGTAILVPVPGSSLTRPNTLWVAKLLSDALVRHGLGSGLCACLSRRMSVPKSAFSKPQDRPTPTRHCETMAVANMVTEPTNILLIDDVVTKGATFLGAACRITQTYPNANIKAFAAMRTVSNMHEFKEVLDPCTGNIAPTADGHSKRTP